MEIVEHRLLRYSRELCLTSLPQGSRALAAVAGSVCLWIYLRLWFGIARLKMMNSRLPYEGTSMRIEANGEKPKAQGEAQEGPQDQLRLRRSQSLGRKRLSRRPKRLSRRRGLCRRRHKRRNPCVPASKRKIFNEVSPSLIEEALIQ